MASLSAGMPDAVSPEAVGSTRVRDIVSWLDQYWAWIAAVLSVVSGVIIFRYGAVRPGGLDAGGRDVKPIPAVMWLFASFVTFFGLMTVGLAAQSVTFVDAETMQNEAVGLAISFGVAAVFGLGLLFFVADKAPEAGVRPGWADPGLGLSLFLLVYPLVALSGLFALWIARGIGAAGQDRLAHDTLPLIAEHREDPWVWMLIAVLVLIVPLVEELIYRVYLQSAILRVVRSRWIAVLLTSGLFVAAHWSVLPEGGRYAAVPLFVLSVCIGAAYERTGRLGVPVTMHALFNALNLVLAFMIDPMV